MIVRVSVWMSDIPITSVCDFIKYCLWLVKIRLMQVDVTLLKLVGVVIRLFKENRLSSCSILVYPTAMLKSLVKQYGQTTV